MKGKWLISLIFISFTIINAQVEIASSELKFLSSVPSETVPVISEPDESADINYTAEEIIIKKG
jgi:hypothetical protein